MQYIAARRTKLDRKSKYIYFILGFDLMYNRLRKGKHIPVISVHGKAAPKEALAEIAQRTGGIK